jgi:hypothetical protein
VNAIAIFAQIAEFGLLRGFCDYCDLCDPFLISTRAASSAALNPAKGLATNVACEHEANHADAAAAHAAANRKLELLEFASTREVAAHKHYVTADTV